MVVACLVCAVEQGATSKGDQHPNSPVQTLNTLTGRSVTIERGQETLAVGLKGLKLISLLNWLFPAGSQSLLRQILSMLPSWNVAVGSCLRSSEFA